MRNLIGALIGCMMFITSAGANSDRPVTAMSHTEAAALINEAMDNWTDNDLGKWIDGHSYKYQDGHGFVSMMYGIVFIFNVAKTQSVLDENGFSCSRTIASVYLPSDLDNATNGIAVKICVKGDSVLVDITGSLKRLDSI